MEPYYLTDNIYILDDIMYYNKSKIIKITNNNWHNYLDEYGWEHYTIKGKKYDIRFDRSRLEWACDCPAFTYRRKFRKKYCKHILVIQDKKWKRKIK